LTVVAFAPQASGPRCGASNDAYNCAVRDEAAAELSQAAELLGPLAERTRFKLLVEGRDPPLEAWVEQNRFGLVLLPARRAVLRSGGHPAARRLRRFSDAAVDLVAPRQRRGPAS
jgi:hypothetical protein